MKKLYFLLTGITMLTCVIQAQTPDSEQPFYHRSGPGGNNTASFSGTSGTGSNLDVVFTRAEWSIDPNNASKVISGVVTHHFRTITNNVSTITFDLNKTSFDNASLVVRRNGVICTKSVSTSNVLTVTLPSTIVATNTLDSISITYSGTPPGVVGTAQGYQRATSPHNYISTLSESYEDRDWWPCKADMQDKIDAMDIYVTVPWGTPAAGDTFWVATNGKLIDSTITGTSRRFYFQHRYPIASYLVAVSVARFDRIYKTVDVNGTNTQVAYYLLRGKTAATKTGIVTAMDKINLVLQAFGARIGDYPFKNEKHGFYDGLMGAGGMEHQTFSGMATSALTNLRTLTHELMHQWFGDNVSFATWNDLWLAEGFARYSEVLCGELVPSLGLNPYSIRTTLRSNALSYTTTPTWIPDAEASTSDGHWGSTYGSTVYERGGMVVSMLRTLCGDSVFFKVLNQYQTNLAGQAVTTDTLRNYFNRELGQDISEFFRDYVGGSGKGATPVGGMGHPTYNLNWGNPAGTTFRVAIASQTRSAGTNVAYFNGPVLVHVTNGPAGLWTKDTTIVFYDWGGGNLSRAGRGMNAPEPGNQLQYHLSFVPTNVFFDDSARLMASAGTINKVSLVDMEILDFNVKQFASGNFATLQLDDNTGNSTIEIERSGDGTQFTKIGDMAMLNTGSFKYTFNDASPLKSDNYYRASFVTADGARKYSRIVRLSNNTKSVFSLVNNPVNGKIKIRNTTANSASQAFVFMVYDAAGKLVHHTERSFTSGTIEIDADHLAAGQYILTIGNDNENMESLKFIVK